MISGNSKDEQNSGTTAILVNGVQKYAVDEQYTTSQWGIRVVPMPMAGPLTAATSCPKRNTQIPSVPALLTAHRGGY